MKDREKLVIVHSHSLREYEEIKKVKIPRRKDLEFSNIFEKLSEKTDLPGEDSRKMLIGLSNYLRGPIIIGTFSSHEDELQFKDTLSKKDRVAGEFFGNNKLLAENIRPVLESIHKYIDYYFGQAPKFITFFHILREIGEHNNIDNFFVDYERVTINEKIHFVEELVSFIKTELLDILILNKRPE